MKVGISIPTFNEATNILHLLEAITENLQPVKDITVAIVVVDDSSPDGTGQLVKDHISRLKNSRFSIEVLTRLEKDGFGRACVAGFKHLLAKKVDYIIQMDADLSHDPVYLPAFIEDARKGHDFVVASRYIRGGQTPDWPLYRRLLSKYGNYYARLILSKRVSDYTGGFNLYSRSLLESIDLDSLRATGYGFLIELKYRALNKAKSLQEIPIIFNDRQHGQSKIPKSTLFKNLILVPQIRLSKVDNK